MIFNSFSYAIFLPIVFFLYWLPFRKIRSVWQNSLLLIASYIFYGAWDWRFAILIAFTSLTSWLSGILIEKNEGRKLQYAAANIIVNLCILGYFKYAGFFADSFRALLSIFGIEVGAIMTGIILPVGISFYTFQSLGYTIDVYRGKVEACKDPMKFFTFVSFFPQLVAGPIERASNLLPQFSKAREFDYEKAVEGLMLIIWGLFLKITIADRLAVFVDSVWADIAKAGGISSLVAIIFFAFQLYVDFYSYSEIARGSSKLFSIELMVNFRRPYLSTSFREFWKRWHISLSSWFGEYVYIPLGGNRRGVVRKVFNTFVVFLLSGLWHGASWTFAAWGFLCALFLVLFDKPLSHTASVKVFNRFVVFALWALSLVLFRAHTFPDALSMFSSIGFGNWAALTSMGLGKSELCVTLFLLILLVVQELWFEKKETSIVHAIVSKPVVVRVVFAVVALLVIILLGRYGIGNDSRFIYFQF